MKKAITLLLLISSFCILLCACSGYEKGKTFSKDFLRSVSLEKMPLPECENYSINNTVVGQEALKAEISRADFNSYVESFVQYMKARTDIYHFGIEYHEGLIAEIAPHNIVHQMSDDDSYADSDRLVFCYSQSAETTTVSSCEHLHYKSMTAVTMDYDGEKGIAYIKIDADANSSCIDEELSTPYVFELDHTEAYYRISGIRRDMAGEITLPETYKGLPVKEIGLWGFSANDGIGSTNGVTKLIIPDCYEKIGANAFDNMLGLTTVSIGNGVKEIGPQAFEGCKNLETVIFGSSVEAIYAEAFQYCEKLDHVVLPASLKEITYRAFSECKSLKSIVIPRGVTEMLADVFFENDSLTDIYCEIEAQPDGWNEEWCGNDAYYLANSDVKVTFGYGGESPVVHYSVSYDGSYKYKPIYTEKPSYLYAPGSEVTFYLSPIEDTENVAMYINGVRHSVGVVAEVPEEGGDGTKALWKYTFTMPEGHAKITFQAETGGSEPA